MEQGLLEEAQDLEEALDEAEVEAEWMVVVSVWVENASAQIAVIEQLTKGVPPVMR